MLLYMGKLHVANLNGTLLALNISTNYFCLEQPSFPFQNLEKEAIAIRDSCWTLPQKPHHHFSGVKATYALFRIIRVAGCRFKEW